MLSNEIASNFVPLFDRILVRKLRPEAVSRGGVYLPPDVTQDSVVKAEVLAVGQGVLSRKTGKYVRNEKIGCGDFVLIPDYAGYKFKDELCVVREEEVLGMMKK